MRGKMPTEVVDKFLALGIDRQPNAADARCKLDAYRRENCDESAHLRLTDACFDPRDGRMRHAGHGRQVALTQSTQPPRGA